jgi:hypothetical protein
MRISVRPLYGVKVRVRMRASIGVMVMVRVMVRTDGTNRGPTIITHN